MQQKLNYLKDILKNRSFLLWIVLFVVINIASRTGGGTNESSRLATLRAMSEQFTFKINDYVDWTIDWAQTPDGAYYSNKAPGPMLIGFPLFFVLDRASGLSKKEVRAEKTDVAGKAYSFRPNLPGPTTRSLLALFMQVLPLAFLVAIIALHLQRQNFSHGAVNFFVLAALFGNTAVIFSNSYFGHAFVAQFVLGSCYFFYRKSDFVFALCLGVVVLSEYTAALLLPIFALALWMREKANWQVWKNFVLGGLGPGLLWCWYHISTCGSPFKITAQFQNPIWLNMAHEENNLWGLFALKFNFPIYFELLFGNSRGLLVTQPWALAVLLVPLLVWRFNSRDLKIENILATAIFISFLVLFFMNSTFGGWHGGHSSGPRYLSMIIPALALMAVLYWSHLPFWFKSILWLGLVPALILRALIYGSTTMAHDGHPLWKFLWEFMSGSEENRGQWRFAIMLLCFSFIGSLITLLNRRKKN